MFHSLQKKRQCSQCRWTCFFPAGVWWDSNPKIGSTDMGWLSQLICISYSKKTASHRCTPPHKGFGMKSETQKWMIWGYPDRCWRMVFSISVRTDMDCGFSKSLKSAGLYLVQFPRFAVIIRQVEVWCIRYLTSGQNLYVFLHIVLPPHGDFRQNQELRLQLDLLKRWETQWLKFVKVVGPTLQNSADSFMMISKGIQSSG